MKEEEQRVLYSALKYVKDNTSPDDPIFVMPYHSLFYFFSERKNPTRFDIIWEAKTYKERDKEIIDALDRKNVKFVIYSPTQPPDWGRVEEFAPRLMRLIMSRYSVDTVFGDPAFGLSFIVLKRKEITIHDRQQEKTLLWKGAEADG